MLDLVDITVVRVRPHDLEPVDMTFIGDPSEAEVLLAFEQVNKVDVVDTPTLMVYEKYREQIVLGGIIKRKTSAFVLPPANRSENGTQERC